MSGPDPGIENIYPLSPIQEGLLFHALNDPASGAYFIQLTTIFKGQLRLPLLRNAWLQVIARHPVLRTSFVPEHRGRALQIAHKTVELPWAEEDWRVLSPAEQRSRFDDYLAMDRRSGFDLKRAPLMRLSIIRLGQDRFQLLWSFHHLLLDGWSVALVIGEVFRFYESACAGRELFIPKPRPFSDYIAWLKNQDEKESEKYWRSLLAGFTTPTSLGIERDKNSLAGHQEEKFGYELLELNQEETSELEHAAQHYHITLNTIIQGAWALLLSRYSGQQDVVFGATTSGRPAELPGVEKMVGAFINTLPVRPELDESEKVVGMLRRLQHQQTESRRFEHTPLVQVQRWAQLSGGTPLFETMVVFENYPASKSMGPGSTGLQLEYAQTFEATSYPLAICVTPGTRLSFRMAYDRGIFEQGKARRIAGHWEKLLMELMRRPEALVCELEMLSPQERQQLLLEWNRTTVDYNQQKRVHELIIEQADRSPDSIALIHNGEDLTYRELKQRINRLANYLRSLGIGPEMRVGLLLGRSPDMVVAVLGVLNAGAAYVPLDAEHPRERLRYFLSDSDVKLVITSEFFREKLTDCTARVLVLEEDLYLLDREILAPPASLTSPDHIAYIIYTSGSTGLPKGVVITHRSLENHLRWRDAVFPLNACDRVLLIVSFSFDASIWPLFGSLLSGASIVLGTPSESLSLLVNSEVTYLPMPPALLTQLIAAPDLSRCRSLKAVLYGGESLNLRAQDTLCRNLAWISLHNLYGPTEVTVDASYIGCKADAGERIDSIGRPVANTEVYILDPALRLLPAGNVGEICVGGRGLARGYWRRPEMTAEKFAPNPYASRSGERLYRTGDFGRFLSDGRIELLGRTDRQVKIRGLRIELGEIEAALNDYEGVAQSLVLLHEGTPERKRLVAYFLKCASDTDLRVTDLRSYLRQRLPEYMIPESFVALEEFPLTIMGKVDFKRLPSPAVESDDYDNQRQPGSGIEDVLVNIWSDVLEVAHVGLDSNFFDLGGHSLFLVQIASRIRKSLGVELPLRIMFERPTVRQFAREVENRLRRQHGTLAPPLISVRRDADLPLSFAQQRLWFLQNLDPDSAAYNIPLVVRMNGEIDRHSLQRAFTELVTRHEVLRARVQMKSIPVQVIEELVSGPWIEHVNLNCSVENISETEVIDMVATEIRRPFDLENDPPLRVRLLCLSPREHVLVVVVHHIACDGWSIGILIRELGVLYRAFTAGEESPLSQPSFQYGDYAVWQRDWLRDEVLERELTYWRNQLHGLERLELPVDHLRPALQTFNGGSLSRELESELSRSIVALAKREGATLFMALVASWQMLLVRYSGQKDVAVGTPVSGRNYSEIENLIGCFVNSLVLRAQLYGNLTIKEVLKKVRETAIEAYAHQDLPFEQIVEALAPEPDLSRNPLFSVMLSMQNVPVPGPIQSDLNFVDIQIESGMTAFDLSVSLWGDRDRISVRLEYNTDLFEQPTIERMLTHWQVLLGVAAKQPDARFLELELLTDAEQQQTLLDWNSTEAYYEQEKCLYQLFEQQVERTPSAVAVLDNAQELTYTELNRRSNQLAHYLIHKGVRAEKRVGICLERSSELITALLAVLKAGGAYVPLDPALPAERLSFMIRDAGLTLTITRSAFRFPGARLELDDQQQKNGIQAQKITNPGVSMNPENLAYVIYTSGSTGAPKGVMVHHAGLHNVLRSFCRYLVFNPGDSILWTTTLSFDIAGLEILMPLIHGGQVLVGWDVLRVSLADVLNELEKLRPRFMQMTPAGWRLLAQSDWRPDPSVTILCGGEALDDDLQSMFVQWGCAAWNVYGPTETTIWSAALPISTSNKRRIGGPVANTELYVLDERLKAVPVGVSGEIYISGHGLARGYLNRPDLTAESFIPHPYATQGGAQIYRTGDLGRYRTDGSIEFLGRRDRQVKLRGYRIEMGEIEGILQEMEGIEQVLVEAREDRPGQKQLIGYVVCKTGAKRFSADDARDYLKQHLPEYMIPSTYIQLEAFPLTPNGKIDRLRLPKPGEMLQQSRILVGPRSRFELQLVRLWEEVLGIDSVSVKDDFFELGGNSLTALAIVVKYKQRNSNALPLAVLLQNRTIEQVAQFLQSSFSASGPISPLIPLRTGGSRPPLYCVHPLSGHVFGYMELANSLPDQPIYGLQSSYIEGGLVTDTTIEEIAHKYVNEIRAVQPIGPYSLAGWSAGGLIGFEMAQQLTRMGEVVNVLALFDSAPPATPLVSDGGPVLDDAALLADVFGRYLVIGHSSDSFDLPSGTSDERLDYLIEYAQRNKRLPFYLDRVWAMNAANAIRLYSDAAGRYSPLEYSGRILLFRAAESGQQSNQTLHAYGWEEIAPNRVEVFDIPASHSTLLMRGGAEKIARILDQYLVALQSGTLIA